MPIKNSRRKPIYYILYEEEGMCPMMEQYSCIYSRCVLQGAGYASE